MALYNLEGNERKRYNNRGVSLNYGNAPRRSVLKTLRRLVLLALIVIMMTGCIDRPGEQVTRNPSGLDYLALTQTSKYPGDYQTVIIDGREYLQARGDIGKHGGTFYNASFGQGPKTFNPWVSKDATSSELARLMFDSLFSTDAFTGDISPKMAKSYEVSKDQTEYIVHLRKGKQWSDGVPITAADVEFTWNEIIKEGLGNASARDNLLVDGQFPTIQVIDDYTVKFKTIKPFAPFLRSMGGIEIAPKHILKPVLDKGRKAFDSFWTPEYPPESFVTSGMFRLYKYYTGQRVEFTRNPNYYMVDKAGKKLPYIDKYVYYFVSDSNNLLLKFQAGEIDIVNVPGKNVAHMKYDESKPGADFKIYNLGPTTSTTFLAFNLNNRKNPETNDYYVEPMKQRWFGNFYFRKAIDWGIDREGIITNVVQGMGDPLYTAESLPSIYLNEELASGHRRDIEKAKAFLKKGGFMFKNDNLYDDKGNRVEFSLLTNAGNDDRENIGVIIKEDLEKLGMKVNFKAIEFNALVGKITQSTNWDAIIIGLTGNPLEPHSGRNVWNSDGELHIFNQRLGKAQETKEKLYPFEKELDVLFEKGAQTLEKAKRKKIYDQYQQVVYDNLPVIYLYSPLQVVAVRNRLKNIHPTLLGGIQHNLEEIYIEE